MKTCDNKHAEIAYDDVNDECPCCYEMEEKDKRIENLQMDNESLQEKVELLEEEKNEAS